MKQALPFILIALAIITFFIFIDPQYKEVQVLSKQKEENHTMLGLAQDLQKKRDTLRKSYDDISVAEKQELAKLLPDTVDNVRLILDINNVAEQYGILIRDISVTREGDKTDSRQKNVVSSIDVSGDVGTITLSFSVTASYDIFVSFMKDLEEALRIVDIRAFEITAANTKTQGGFYTFAITLDTYWLR